MDDNLINGIARAKFLMRVFTTKSLTSAGTLNNALDRHWPHSDYEAWSFLSDKGKLKWREEAVKWLHDLKNNRPLQYDILVKSWRDIDNE